MKKNIMIELTPLLDIILILLFITITATGGKATENNELLDRLTSETEMQRAELSAQEQEIASLKETLEKYENVDGISSVQATQYAAFLEHARAMDIVCTRVNGACEVRIVSDSGKEETVTISASDTGTLARETSVQITAAMQSFAENFNAEVTVVTLRYNNRQIYRFQYQVVCDAIDAFQQTQTANVLVAEGQIYQ